ncbi:PhzF family phenazine biosynthesis protein [Methylotuvimicrobium sp.]|uniref:PhzF family phenazine biosynthesis protein n=1 Tax=Methylotuvimicrobium sp. TaxID=2822413 RepID=UPI003D65E00C
MCPLKNWLDDDLLQAIAEEINLSETAFFVPSAKGFNLRWFTPIKKVVLCGHASLAKAHIIFESLGFTELVITFETRSGDLFVKKRGSLLQMDFPANKLTACEISEALVQCFACVL